MRYKPWMFGAVLLAVMVLGAGFSAALAKEPIRIVNEGSRTYSVSAYDQHDNVQLVACQAGSVAKGSSRAIEPKTAGRLELLFKDHCGLYEKLSIKITYMKTHPTRQPKNVTIAKFDNVPWGATIVIRPDNRAECQNC